ncbi:hypothetical protein AVEN_269517-1 [Araneus ventricosus]|uniref:Uncharacterized protein n=1 Tax=Araneus ventricosus TaxID=182803 RepID=A0A4Y1ZS59_ARAVE|nr:hypothetical protein AVEN_269517-1 [Araneus ventricosus]
MESPLAPWQRIDALVSFIYPALQFLMRTAQFKEDWTLFDEALRRAIKTHHTFLKMLATSSFMAIVNLGVSEFPLPPRSQTSIE